MQVQKIDNYTPEQEAARRRILTEVKKQQRYYSVAVKPLLDELVQIEFRHNVRYVLMPDVNG